MSEKSSSSRCGSQTGPSRNSKPPEIRSALWRLRNMPREGSRGGRTAAAGVRLPAAQDPARETPRGADPRTDSAGLAPVRDGEGVVSRLVPQPAPGLLEVVTFPAVVGQ